MPGVMRENMIQTLKLKAGRYRHFEKDFNMAQYVINLAKEKADNQEKIHFRIPNLIAYISRMFNVSPEEIKKLMEIQMYHRVNDFSFERTSEVFVCPKARKGTMIYKKQTRLYLKKRGSWLSHVWVRWYIDIRHNNANQADSMPASLN